jgi:hypothetical protein
MEYIKKALPDSLIKRGALLLGVGVIILALGFVFDFRRAMFDYLWIYMFLVSIAIGSLAFVALEYVVGASWSTPFRRIIEITASLSPVLIILVIPLLLGMHELYSWTHAEVVQQDAVLKGKESYLNFQFFSIRTAFCLLVWYVFYHFLTKNSEKQDATGEASLTKRNIRISVPFMPLFVITLTIFAVDWMMSLEPHWYSTIFGLYYFSGTVVAALAANTFILVKLKEGKYLVEGINNDHFYSLSTLIFAFNIFWAYIGFSQYLLIWYADIPEETFWFLMRWNGSWKYVSIALLFFHFVIPFLILVSRGAKTNLLLLKIMSIWMLAAHALDIYWLIFPTYFNEGASFGWSELSFPFFVAGLVMVVFKIRAAKKNLVAIGDPKLQDGLNFHL